MSQIREQAFEPNENPDINKLDPHQSKNAKVSWHRYRQNYRILDPGLFLKVLVGRSTKISFVNIEHELVHYYQPTNNSCCQSSFAMTLSQLGADLTPEDVLASVPVRKRDDGSDWGTILQNLATWALTIGYKSTIYSADFGILDFSWKNLDKNSILNKLKLSKGHRTGYDLGPINSDIYLDSYIEFLEKGGELIIETFFTSALIDRLLESGPILSCVSAPVLYGQGRRSDIALRKSIPNDIDGIQVNHSIVIYGKDDNDQYLIADPWKEPGRSVISSEHLLASLASSIVECDNILATFSRV